MTPTPATDRLHSREGNGAPARDEGEQARPEVPSGVDGVAAVETKTDSHTEDNSSHRHGYPSFRDAHVARVRDGAHAQQQDECAQDLQRGSPN